MSDKGKSGTKKTVNPPYNPPKQTYNPPKQTYNDSKPSAPKPSSSGDKGSGPPAGYIYSSYDNAYHPPSWFAPKPKPPAPKPAPPAPKPAVIPAPVAKVVAAVKKVVPPVKKAPAKAPAKKAPAAKVPAKKVAAPVKKVGDKPAGPVVKAPAAKVPAKKVAAPVKKVGDKPAGPVKKAAPPSYGPAQPVGYQSPSAPVQGAPKQPFTPAPPSNAPKQPYKPSSPALIRSPLAGDKGAFSQPPQQYNDKGIPVGKQPYTGPVNPPSTATGRLLPLPPGRTTDKGYFWSPPTSFLTPSASAGDKGAVSNPTFLLNKNAAAGDKGASSYINPALQQANPNLYGQIAAARPGSTNVPAATIPARILKALRGAQQLGRPSTGGGTGWDGGRMPTIPSGGGGNGTPIPTPTPTPVPTPQPPIKPPVKPPVTPPPVTPPRPPGAGTFTNIGVPGTYGRFQRQRRARGPLSGLSLTPEMLRRIAAQRIGQR